MFILSSLIHSGVVFPYFTHVGRYSMNFQDAVQACMGQNSVVATFDQLFEAWKGGLDWCNAGWLDDGTVQYPITKPREPCGGSNSVPGLRNYGLRDKMSYYDVFCYATALNGEYLLCLSTVLIQYSQSRIAPCRKHSLQFQGFISWLVDQHVKKQEIYSQLLEALYLEKRKYMSLPPVLLFLLSGNVYWLVQPERLTFDEAVQACLDDGAEIAKVGHIYSAWKLEGYDRCDAGWLADGSVRYPISRPRKNCSPTEAAVRFVGFPDKTQKLYGVYCYKADQWRGKGE